MSAGRLREAAALMRERAEAANEAAWDWRAKGSGKDWWSPGGTGRHIASWHPAVALAVAHMLERVADDYAIAQYGYWSVLAEQIADAYLGGLS